MSHNAVAPLMQDLELKSKQVLQIVHLLDQKLLKAN